MNSLQQREKEKKKGDSKRKKHLTCILRSSRKNDVVVSLFLTEKKSGF